MWETVFVFENQKQEKSPRAMPPFTVEGHIMLWDTLKEPHKYKVTRVIFDMYAEPPLQYVYLTELLDV